MGQLRKGKFCDLLTLSRFSVKHLKPTNFILAGVPGYAATWSSLCHQIVKVLVQLELLTESKLPIYNHMENGKYFINTKPRHEIAHLNGEFKQVAPGVFVDAKYLSDRNIKNLIYLFEQLDIDPKHLEVEVV